MLSSWCPYKLFVFAVIMATAPVGFPVPQMQEGLDEREALDCFILDYIDYCTVMGWFERRDRCKYDDQSEDGEKTMGETKPLHVNTSSNSAFEDKEID